MLVNGAEFKRTIGFNFDLLDTQLEKISQYHRQANYFGDSGNQWERFYDAFDRFEKDGEGDRDCMRMMTEY